MITLKDALDAVEVWKGESSFEVAGGVWKGKPVVHDIDLVVKSENVQAVFGAVSRNKVACAVEIYIPATPNDEERLLVWLRAHRNEIYGAKGKYGRALNEGLHFSKMKIY